MSEVIKIEYYFVWDDMIVLKSNNWDDVLEEAIEYFNTYGKDHSYVLYTVNKYDFKEMRNSKECQ